MHLQGTCCNFIWGHSWDGFAASIIFFLDAVLMGAKKFRLNCIIGLFWGNATTAGKKTRTWLIIGVHCIVISIFNLYLCLYFDIFYICACVWQTKLLTTRNGHGQSGWSPIGCECFHTNVNIPSPLPTTLYSLPLTLSVTHMCILHASGKTLYPHLACRLFLKSSWILTMITTSHSTNWNQQTKSRRKHVFSK